METNRSYTREEVAELLTADGWTFDLATYSWQRGGLTAQRLCRNEAQTQWWLQGPSVAMRLPASIPVVG